MKFTIEQCIKASAIIHSGPIRPEQGVCGNIDYRGSADFQAYSKWVTGFPWYAGHPAWPVEGDKIAYDKPGKWEGERGNKRLEFCAAVEGSSSLILEPAYKICVHLQSIMWHGPRRVLDGLCGNLPDAFMSFDVDYTEFCGYTGDPLFPVELEEEYKMPGKWVGTRGERRRALAMFIQGQLITKFLCGK